MGYKRAIRDKRKQAIFDTFHALPDLPFQGEWDCGQVAFPLETNHNPDNPMSGIAVYEVEKVKATAKSVIIWRLKTVWKIGEGKEPKFPYVINLKKHKARLIYRS